jgi:soluble lytic murein transglycosylase-like protein
VLRCCRVPDVASEEVDPMTDPVMMSVASTLASKAAEAAVDGGKTAWGALVRMVRARFGRDQAATAALEAAEARPDDPAHVAELAQVLERIAAADADFAARMRALWQPASVELSARQGSVVNNVTGTVAGHLIQAKDLHVEGGIHLG